MRRRIAMCAWIALGAGVATIALDAAGVLPWPAVASKSLAGLFVLVAITRVAGDLGMTGQRLLRWAVAGVALAAAAGTVTLVLAARIFADGPAAGLAPHSFGRAAPLFAATAALGAVSPVVALAVRLPAIWRVLAPKASPVARQALVWLT